MGDRTRSGSWFGGKRPADAEPDHAEESSRVARRLTAPETGGLSRAGLPIRTPRAHLVPGAFSTPSGADDLGVPDRSAEEMRRHLDGYRAGVDRARRDTA